MTQIILRPYSRTDRDWLVSQHAQLYAEAEGFDDTFGPLVHRILDAFDQNHDLACEAGWIAQQGMQRLGSIFCVRADACTAKLRLFLTLPQARGQGLGQRLLSTCMHYARDRDYAGMELWTHASHAAACALYARNGWVCAGSKPVRSFGVDLVEQRWVYTF
ncbi:MAG: GNAT family N-acetyltransferase [Pseudomonadota bacterium]